MSERQHKAEDEKKKAKATRDIKASPLVAHPVLQLQKLVGNRAVANMIQRSFRDDPEYSSWRERMKAELRPMSQNLNEEREHHNSEGASWEAATTHHNAVNDIWHEATPTSGESSGEGTTTVEHETAASEGE